MLLTNMEYYKDEVFEIIFIRQMTHFWPDHNHPADYQILLVLNGTLQVQFLDESITLRGDDFLVIPPYRVHTETSVEGIDVLCLCVSKNAVEQNGTCVLNLIDDIVEILLQRGLIEKRHIFSLSKAASQILYVFRHKDDECSEFVMQAREMLEKWPEKDILLDEMAELVRICRGHLVRTFRQEVGLTPHQYQLQNRVRQAMRFLIDTDLSVEDIRRNCGFYDSSHFKRHFRRFIGTTPYEYRKTFKGAAQLLLFDEPHKYIP